MAVVWLFGTFCLSLSSQTVSDSVYLDTVEEVIVQTTAPKPERENLIKRLLSNGLNFVAAPIASYQPETSWAFGVVGGYYFHNKKIENSKTSLVNFKALATLNKQYEISASVNVHIGRRQNWILYATLDYKHYTDNFYGIGNVYNNLMLDETGNISPISYYYNSFALNIQPQNKVAENLFVGLNLHARIEEPKGLPKEELERRFNIVGFDRYTMFGLGMLLSYDTRDNTVYPYRGLFGKIVATHYFKLQNETSLNKIQADFRHFLPIYKQFIFAYQLYSEMTLPQKKQRPFQMLPTFGGTDIMRGFRTNMWKDDIVAVAQAELRIPIWSIFRAAAFASIGDVYCWENMDFEKPKIAYGVGLRVQFNKERANVRFDVARQNYDRDWYFYITVNEAF